MGFASAFGHSDEGNGAMDRIQEMTKERRTGVIVIVGVLVMVLVGALLARTLHKNSEADQADQVLEHALQLHAQGDLADAKNEYLRVLQLDPENKYAYYNLGLISQTQGDLVSAESSYRTTIAIDADFVPALFNLAILRTDAGSKREAMDLYRHIIEVTPESDADLTSQLAAAHLNLGFLLLDTGDEAQGQAELDEAVRLDPSLADRIGSGTTGSTGAGASP
jgi:tetratricopeptide (TPR) repeat protein